MIIEREFSLTEILVKTNYQIVISREESFQNSPIAYGSGFFLTYKSTLFFLTADHNIHIEDHEINERTGVDNYVGILNNISNKNTFTTAITSIAGFYCMESLNFNKQDLNPQLIDVAISLVDKKKSKCRLSQKNHLLIKMEMFLCLKMNTSSNLWKNISQHH